MQTLPLFRHVIYSGYLGCLLPIHWRHGQFEFLFSSFRHAKRHHNWPFMRAIPDERWIPLTKGQSCRRAMTSSWHRFLRATSLDSLPPGGALKEDADDKYWLYIRGATGARVIPGHCLLLAWHQPRLVCTQPWYGDDIGLCHRKSHVWDLSEM